MEVRHTAIMYSFSTLYVYHLRIFTLNNADTAINVLHLISKCLYSSFVKLVYHMFALIHFSVHLLFQQKVMSKDISITNDDRTEL